MALQVYEKAAVLIEGQLLSESTTVSVDSDPKLNEIYTMQKGFAGVSPGAEVTTIEVENTVPRIGFEYDYLASLQGVKVVEVTIFAHAKKTTCKGFLTKVSQKYGVNQAATVSFSFIGEPVNESTL